MPESNIKVNPSIGRETWGRLIKKLTFPGGEGGDRIVGKKVVQFLEPGR